MLEITKAAKADIARWRLFEETRERKIYKVIFMSDLFSAHQIENWLNKLYNEDDLELVSHSGELWVFRYRHPDMVEKVK